VDFLSTQFLIDSFVISEFSKPNADKRVVDWLDAAEPELLFLSAVTLGELRMGVEGLALGRRRRELEEWLERGLPAWFASNVLPLDKAVGDRWGRLAARAKKQGMALSTADGQIGATALQHNLVLVTRNVKDFRVLGIEIFNPWES
jgi:toxin FitB